MLYANLMAQSVIEQKLPSKFYTAGIGIFDLFCSCHLDLLDLDPMTFIYKLDSYSLEIPDVKI